MTCWNEIPGQPSHSLRWAKGSPVHSPSTLGLAPFPDIIWRLFGPSFRLPLITHACALVWHREYYTRVRASPSGYSFPFLALEKGNVTLLLQAGMSEGREGSTQRFFFLFFF